MFCCDTVVCLGYLHTLTKHTITRIISRSICRIAIETFGSWGQHGWELVEWVESKIAQSTGELDNIFAAAHFNSDQRGNQGAQRHFFTYMYFFK